MSILIMGMDMPTNCCECPMSGDYKMCCSLMPGVPALYAEFTDAIKTNRRHRDCPLFPIPQHGRLIDADALCDGRVSNDNVFICASTAPTIIPASEEGE